MPGRSELRREDRHAFGRWPREVRFDRQRVVRAEAFVGFAHHGFIANVIAGRVGCAVDDPPPRTPLPRRASRLTSSDAVS